MYCSQGVRTLHRLSLLLAVLALSPSLISPARAAPAHADPVAPVGSDDDGRVVRQEPDLELICGIEIRIVRLSPRREKFVLALSSALPGVDFSEANGDKVDPRLQILDGADYVTKSGSSLVQTFEDTFVISSYLEFHMPGFVDAEVSVSDLSGGRITCPVKVHVLGVVLFTEEKNKKVILSGESAPQLVLKPKRNEVSFKEVKALVYGGEYVAEKGFAIQPHDIILNVSSASSAGSRPLSWDQNLCKVSTKADSLDDRCSMAFSEDFDAFIIRVPPGEQFDSPLVVFFDWPGLADYIDASETGTAGEQFQSSNSEEGDRATLARFSPPLVDAVESSSMAAWKVIVIAITCLAMLLAAIILAFCYLRGRKAESLGRSDATVKKDKEGLASLRGFLASSRGGKVDPSCYVDEPPPRRLPVLMLEDNLREGKRVRGGAHESSIAPNSSTDAANHLLWPNEVNRGEDLEWSTGGLSIQVGSPYEEDELEATSCGGREMTSVPNNMYASGRDEESGPRDGSGRSGVGSVGEAAREADPGRYRDRTEDGAGAGKAVGAAIYRVRQVDLIFGPASRGLVGRHGMPVDGIDRITDYDDDDDDDDPERKVISPMSLSNLS